MMGVAQHQRRGRAHAPARRSQQRPRLRVRQPRLDPEPQREQQKRADGRHQRECTSVQERHDRNNPSQNDRGADPSRPAQPPLHVKIVSALDSIAAQPRRQAPHRIRKRAHTLPVGKNRPRGHSQLKRRPFVRPRHARAAWIQNAIVCPGRGPSAARSGRRASTVTASNAPVSPAPAMLRSWTAR